MADMIELIAAAIGREVLPWTVPYKPQVQWPQDYTEDEKRTLRRAAQAARAAIDTALKEGSA